MAHPQLFRLTFKTNPRYTFRVNVADPPAKEAAEKLELQAAAALSG